MRMGTRAILQTLIIVSLAPLGLYADFTPVSLTEPFGVQPFAGLFVTSGQSDTFFSDLSGLPFPGPGIVTILADLQAFDVSGDPISSFTVTGVTVTQGASMLTPAVMPFDLSSPIVYTSTLDPFSQVTVDPGDLNLAFQFNSDPSFQYSYSLSVTGIPDGGFLLYNDVEGAAVPEPALAWPVAVSLASMLLLLRVRPRTATSF